MDCHLSFVDDEGASSFSSEDAETRTILLLDTTFPPNVSFDDFNKDVDEKREHLLFVVVLEITSLRVVDVDDDFDDDFDDFENKTGGFVTAANILGKRSLKDARACEYDCCRREYFHAREEEDKKKRYCSLVFRV